MRSSDIHELVVDVLWSQWGALGVPAAAARSTLLVDPEALIVETAWRTRTSESRVRDGALSWLVRYHPLVTTVRLRSLVRRADAGLARESLILCRQVADNGVRISWPMATDAPAWNASTHVELPSLPDRPELLRIRCRALFGSNARAEVTALLATQAGPVGVPVIVARTGYSRRQVVEALLGLERAGWVMRTSVGSSPRHALAGSTRALLGFALQDLRVTDRKVELARQSNAPAWLDWFDRFTLIRLLESAADHIEGDDPVAALLLLRTTADAFLEAGIAVPDVTGSHESSGMLAARIAEWIAGTANRLAGRAAVL
jgi:hypothetical protein